MSLDYSILRLLNTSHSSWTLDDAMIVLADNDFLKGAVLVLFWWVWFRSRADDGVRRRILVSTLPSAFIAFFVGRLFANVLPFRLRPFANPNLHWRFPAGFDSHLFLRRWSSFPSDHAACYAAVIFPLLLVSPRVGLVGLLYTLVVIDFPRIYLGLHYPTDILGGILVGFAVAGVMASAPVRERISPPLLRLLDRRPELFYASVFLCLFAIGSINSIHNLATAGIELLHALHHHLAVGVAQHP